MTILRGLGSLQRLLSSTVKNSYRNFASLPPEAIVFPDPEMVVCWHPEKEFPYECSKPLPEPRPPVYSILKADEREARSVYARKRSNLEIAQECAKITYTTMHPWFPRARDKKAKKTKPDRRYL